MVLLMLASAALGLALVALTVVMARMGLPPFGDYFGMIAYALLGFGIGGLALALGFPAAVFYLASNDSRVLSRAVIRVRADAVNALQGVERGVPFYGGQGLSGMRLRN